MTGRACMGEVLIQVWLKSVKKQVATSECTKREFEEKVPDENETKKKRCMNKYVLMEKAL